MLAEMTTVLKQVVANQEKFEAEQKRRAAALGEAGVILLDHTRTLSFQGAACIRMARIKPSGK